MGTVYATFVLSFRLSLYNGRTLHSSTAMIRRLWLLFAQTVTVGLALFLVFQGLPSNPPEPAATATSDLTVAVRRASPAVVTVLARRTLRPESGVEIGSDWHDAPELNVQPLGSGVVLDEEGFVLTNHHVVEGIKDLLVTTSGTERHWEARLVGTDPETDLALLRVTAPKGALTPIRLAQDAKLEVGQAVLAIGNPFGVGQTVTSGIISALGRHGLGLNIYEDFIQTDAAINLGNSGGALVNTEGELIGINSAIFAPDFSEGFVGISFAIPTSLIQNVLPSLKAGSEVVRGYFGFIPRQLTPELAQDLGLARQDGVMVKRVLADSPAERAGLRPFDIVLAIDGEAVLTAHRLLQRIARMRPGDTVTLSVLRGRQTIDLPLVVSRRPSDSLEREEFLSDESSSES